LPTSRRAFSAELLLLLTAAIWGFAFVAQRAGMASIGPFAYMATRYAIGALAILPLILVRRAKAREADGPASFPGGAPAPGAVEQGTWKRRLGYPALAGTILFLGASFQQVGLVTTTAGNAAFITSLYVVLVPIIGLFLGKSVGGRGWMAALLSVIGLYVISVGGALKVAPGDLLVLAGSFFWALHIIVIGRIAPKTDPIELAAGQFIVCALYSLGAAFLLDPPLPGGSLLAALSAAAIPILYAGILSSGVAFTLQIVAQRSARPGPAAILMALEGLFGAIGGCLILGEPLTARLAIGGCLMLAGAILSQLPGGATDKAPPGMPAPRE
jgi:drug/metabolite transporter (DMT)-like permease